MRRADRDRGAASILVLAVGLALVLAGLGGASIGSARVGRHEAHNAADLGALAGAGEAVHGEVVACAKAGRFVDANGGEMTFCSVDGLEVVVRARILIEPMPGLDRHAEAAARAGPLYVVGEPDGS